MAYFDHMSVQDVIDFVTNIRKITIADDIRRHKRMLLQIKLGIGHYKKKDIEWIKVWIERLREAKKLQEALSNA